MPKNEDFWHHNARTCIFKLRHNSFHKCPFEIINQIDKIFPFLGKILIFKLFFVKDFCPIKCSCLYQSSDFLFWGHKELMTGSRYAFTAVCLWRDTFFWNTTSRLRKLLELSVIISYSVAPVKALTHANLCHRLPF